MIVRRHVRRAALCLFACGWVSCKVYDAGLITPDAPVSASDTGVATPDASLRIDAPMCVASTEVCNNLDDDCDGTVDEAASVQADCAMRVVHANSVCQGGKCVYLRECYAGYFNCDGRPENGCEANCPCATGCVDAADADSGPSDAG
jgi:hypothetical protein